MKAKACAEVGIKFTHVQLDASTSVDEIIGEVKRLNADGSVSAVLVQLPLGEHVGPEGERSVTEAVDPKKDVDGYVSLLPSQCPSVPVFPLVCAIKPNVFTASTPTISATYHQRLLNHCSSHAPLLASSTSLKAQE
jgi:Tetrahydrofolate dehydrogenase/cyclohydrolase, catalytic domain